MGVEDPQGNPARLSIYNYPTLFDATTDDLDALFPLGSVLLIREPTYKLALTTKTATMRVDSPSDVIFLDKDDPILNEVQWRLGCSIYNTPELPTSADTWRARGGTEFKAQRWLAAAVCYTRALKLDQDSQVLRLNRAETYLRLGW